jgi:protein-L-isoaspartate(D-aspartate) O-methyltransferase
MAHNRNFALQRQQLVKLLRQNDIHDERVLAAMGEVPREFFVEDDLLDLAYINQALPLQLGQTISQPLMVALMTQALRLTGTERVLEIGTGSGYQAAILSQLCVYVYSIERYEQLSAQAASRLAGLRIQNVTLRVGDGTLGWPDLAPFDRILVTAAAPHLPTQLISQLIVGGIMVVPVGDQSQQTLQVIQRDESGTHIESLGRCVFVPLIGWDAW